MKSSVVVSTLFDDCLVKESDRIEIVISLMGVVLIARPSALFGGKHPINGAPGEDPQLRNTYGGIEATPKQRSAAVL